LEGPLAALHGSVRVDADASEVVWTLEIRGLTDLPTALTHELTNFIIPRWLDSLVEKVAR
jgi:hypothetical protein